MPWPEATPLLPPGPAALKNLEPVGGGYLDLRLPWLTLIRAGPEPGYLTRIGPITSVQANYLALLAAADPAVEWRVVITNDGGRANDGGWANDGGRANDGGWAIAVTRIRSPRAPVGPTAVSPARITPARITPARITPARISPAPVSPAGISLGSSSLVRRVTVVMAAEELNSTAGSGLFTDDDLAPVATAIIIAARRAVDRAARRAAADAAAGGCAHTQASPAYQVPARIREFINLRDLTCRFPTCRQPAQHCDADHTKPYDQGGPTCLCNLGCLCRFHHQLKQHRGWHLDQPAPGTFVWTTSTGLTYTTQPDAQAA